MRIVVVGASGNVGTALLRELAEHDLVGLARRPPEPAAFPGVTWHSVDLTGDVDRELETAFAGADAVVHLAWGFQPTHDEAYLERLALGGTSQVLAAAARARVPHVLHMSSLGAYSPGRDDLADETYPTEGVPTSPYSRHKAAAERILDDFETEHPDVVVTRMRPSLIAQRTAASGLLRYVVPAAVPAEALRLARVLPLDRDFRIQLTHADDVAAAFRLAIEQRAHGAFNLAAEPVLWPADIAAALGARHVHVPITVLRRAADLSWRAHLQQVDVGWLDMAWQLPLLDATRARTELGWTPRHDARAVLQEVVDALREGAHGSTPALRQRTVREGVAKALSGAGVSLRRRP